MMKASFGVLVICVLNIATTSLRFPIVERLGSRFQYPRSNFFSRSTIRALHMSASLEDEDMNADSPGFTAFSKLGLLADITKGLSAQELEEPTPVQRSTIPRLLAGDNLVMSASTGSGKTLAYLLPIIQSLVSQELAGYRRSAMRPRALVLVPTRELARQVLQEIKSISHYCKVSSTAVLGGESSGPQRKALERTQDIVVASPARLLQHKEKGNVYFSQVTHVVIDEVDTMLTQGFGPDIRAILRATRHRSDDKKNAQLIMASATLTPAVRKLLDDVNGFDIAKSDSQNLTPAKKPTTEGNSRVGLSIVEVDGVGRSLSNHAHLVEDVKGRDKLLVLRDLLMRDMVSVSEPERGLKKKTMVFCNTMDSCRAVEHALSEAQVPCLSYHGGLNSREREKNMALFRGDSRQTTLIPGPEAQLLVCTDIAARGIDISDVGHVLMFDHPLNAIDYIHRAGRTGRAGRRGKVTAIVTKRDKVLSDAIQNAVARGLPLDTLSSDKRDYGPQGKLAAVMGHKTGRKSNDVGAGRRTKKAVAIRGGRN